MSGFEETEEVGTDLEQMVSMLEEAEIDYVEDYLNDEEEEGDDDSLIVLDINDTVRMVFDSDGSLLEVNPIPN